MTYNVFGGTLNLAQSQSYRKGFNNWSCPPPKFSQGSKSTKFGVVFNITQLSAAHTENAARYPNAETDFLCRNDRPMSSPSLVKLGPRIPENRLSVARRKLNS